ncbi:MAG TPA: hypothetical protein VFZ59_00050 [Verrucomicrobiae bacterium]|nr:hypothetical protein [Verrucomicrobiae bacterium]
MKIKSIYVLASTIFILGACKPQGDQSGAGTNNVSPPTETNTVPQVNRPPEIVTTNSAVTNAPPR